MLLRLILALTAVGAAVAKYGPFTGHKVVRVVPNSESQLKLLGHLLQSTNLDIWQFPSRVNAPVDIRLSPFEYDDVTNSLRGYGLQPEDMISDLQFLVDTQLSRDARRGNDFDYSKYHQLPEIYSWLEDMANTYKPMASLFNVTSSYEGRPLMGIKISTPSTTVAGKPAFFMEGGIHAREWISPATVIYIASQMLSQYKLDPELTKLVQSFDWYILPVTNPDGYAFTWTSDKNRLWRKTRSKHGLCVGVDPNRNWDDHWCETGASKSPCSDIYCGPKAFSEVEVKGVADFVMNIRNLSAFIDFHSYSELWMSPWGYTKKLPKDFSDQDAAGAAAVDALKKVYGTSYDHGTIANIIYAASGSSADWVYDKVGTKYSYGVELRDKGKYGFLLPEEQILPSGQETLKAVAALAEFILQQGN